jgi:hypothetical protein
MNVVPSSFGVKECLTFEDRHYVLTKCCMQMLKKTLSTLIIATLTKLFHAFQEQSVPIILSSALTATFIIHHTA